ncbi:MAG: DUF4215 domain-containing protein [Sandaracinaceae bacterium]
MNARTVSILVLGAAMAACSDSHGPGDDDAGGIVFDAGSQPDGGAPRVCGNGRLEPGEMCDDGNNTAGDGCDATCGREAFCGDMTVDTGETCDDGNNRSGDGCRSDCGSDETCGNGIVDFAVGEICDGSPMCGVDCHTVTGCGDATVTPPEVCDDGNMASFDGCSGACANEIALVMDSLALATRGHGCDLNGDGAPDNAFAIALGLISGALGPLIMDAVINGDTRLLLAMQGLDDPQGIDDSDFRIAWLLGADADGDPSNDYNGTGTFTVDPNAINPDGSAVTSVQSRVMGRMVFGGPEDIPLPTGAILPIELKDGRIQGTTVAAGGELYNIEDGLLCGGIPIELLSVAGGFLGSMLSTDPPCDGGDPPELLDVLIAGGTATVMFGGNPFPLTFSGTAPDLDLDHDGLEGFQITAEGPANCQPVITQCTDGDGTAITGRGCFADPRIADGFSAAFDFTAIHATLVPAP